jgi:hypothetical protein
VARIFDVRDICDMNNVEDKSLAADICRPQFWKTTIFN